MLGGWQKVKGMRLTRETAFFFSLFFFLVQNELSKGPILFPIHYTPHAIPAWARLNPLLLDTQAHRQCLTAPTGMPRATRRSSVKLPGFFSFSRVSNSFDWNTQLKSTMSLIEILPVWDQQWSSNITSVNRQRAHFVLKLVFIRYPCDNQISKRKNSTKKNRVEFKYCKYLRDKECNF